MSIPQIKYYDSIVVSLPQKRIYSRLGYRDGVTNLTLDQKELIDDYIQQAEALLSLKAASLRIEIKENNGSKVFLDNGIELISKNLSRLLYESQEVLFMAATGGSAIVEAIREDSSGQDITKAVVFDAVASETVDSVFDWLREYINREMRRENKQLLGKRFSAGYGDLQLENQKIIYDALELNTIGISITQKYILIPEKSVTAVTGIINLCG